MALKAHPTGGVEVELELVCAHHEEAGVRVFIDPVSEDITVRCRECNGPVASSVPATVQTKGQVH